VRAVLDTSALIGYETGRLVLADLPTDGVLPSVVLEELWLGVLSAADALRDERRRTFDAARSSLDVVPVSADIAVAGAEIRAEGRARGRRYQPLDALIGATGRVLGLPVVTQDRGFEGMAGVDVRVL